MFVSVYNMSIMYEYVYTIYGICVESMKECIYMGMWSMVVYVKLYMMLCVPYPSYRRMIWNIEPLTIYIVT